MVVALPWIAALAMIIAGLYDESRKPKDTELISIPARIVVFLVLVIGVADVIYHTWLSFTSFPWVIGYFLLYAAIDSVLFTATIIGGISLGAALINKGKINKSYDFHAGIICATLFSLFYWLRLELFY